MSGRRFEDKVAVVTGAGSGIGRSTAVALADEGAGVVCLDLNEKGALETADGIESGGGLAIAVTADVSAPAQVAQAIATARSWRGQLDVLANVAGVAMSRPFAETSFEDWHRIIGINLTGVFTVTKYCIDALLESQGAVVNVASLAGTHGIANMTAYCASKGGVVQFTRALARELGGQGVRVNCICPGPIDTALTEELYKEKPRPAPPPLGRRGRPDEVGSAVAYLASDEASFVTGAVLIVDGGMRV